MIITLLGISITLLGISIYLCARRVLVLALEKKFSKMLPALIRKQFELVAQATRRKALCKAADEFEGGPLPQVPRELRRMAEKAQ